MERAKEVGNQTTRFSTGFGVLLAAVFALFAGQIWSLFTKDPSVHSQLRGPWICLVAMIIVGGVVFALDGVLLGASDAAFLRNLTIASVLGVFFPITLMSIAFGWGLTGIWVGQLASVVLRLIGVVVRFRSMKWAR